MERIKLIIVDDHNLFRKGIASMIAQVPDFELIGEASNGQDLLNLLTKITPDLVLMDLQMPVMDGIEATEKIHQYYPNVKIIIISMHEEDRYIINLLEKGVNGYLLKDSDPDEVENAVRRVMAEGFYYSDFVSKIMHRKMLIKQQTTTTKAPFFNTKIHISPREMEVLRLLCEGLSNQEIGEKMFVSPRTIEGHRQHLLDKTGAKNTAGLVAYAFKNDLI